jgi:hypothetical protein
MHVNGLVLKSFILLTVLWVVKLCLAVLAVLWFPAVLSICHSPAVCHSSAVLHFPHFQAVLQLAVQCYDRRQSRGVRRVQGANLVHDSFHIVGSSDASEIPPELALHYASGHSLF